MAKVLVEVCWYKLHGSHAYCIICRYLCLCFSVKNFHQLGKGVWNCNKKKYMLDHKWWVQSINDGYVNIRLQIQFAWSGRVLTSYYHQNTAASAYISDPKKKKGYNSQNIVQPVVVLFRWIPLSLTPLCLFTWLWLFVQLDMWLHVGHSDVR